MESPKGVQAHRGSPSPTCPTFFLLGPNTGLGHNSVVFMIESQIRYVGQAIAAVDKAAGAQALAPTRPPQDAFNAELATRLDRTVWNTGVQQLVSSMSTARTAPCGAA